MVCFMLWRLRNAILVEKKNAKNDFEKSLHLEGGRGVKTNLEKKICNSYPKLGSLLFSASLSSLSKSSLPVWISKSSSEFTKLHNGLDLVVVMTMN